MTQIYWLQENINYWDRFVWILLILPIVGVFAYYRDVRWARYYGSEKIYVGELLMSLKNYKRFTLFLMAMYVCMYVFFYTPFIGISFSEKGLRFIYFKPRPARTATFLELAEYEIRGSRLVLYTKSKRKYVSADTNASLMKEIVTKMKQHAPWIQEGWRKTKGGKTKWGKYF